jgi:hypothetical protein
MIKGEMRDFSQYFDYYENIDEKCINVYVFYLKINRPKPIIQTYIFKTSNITPTIPSSFFPLAINISFKLTVPLSEP